MIYRTNRSNCNSDGDSDSDIDNDSNGDSDYFNEDDGIKKTYTQDEPSLLVNYGVTNM